MLAALSTKNPCETNLIRNLQERFITPMAIYIAIDQSSIRRDIVTDSSCCNVVMSKVVTDHRLNCFESVEVGLLSW